MNIKGMNFNWLINLSGFVMVASQVYALHHAFFLISLCTIFIAMKLNDLAK